MRRGGSRPLTDRGSSEANSYNISEGKVGARTEG